MSEGKCSSNSKSDDNEHDIPPTSGLQNQPSYNLHVQQPLNAVVGDGATANNTVNNTVNNFINFNVPQGQEEPSTWKKKKRKLDLPCQEEPSTSKKKKRKSDDPCQEDRSTSKKKKRKSDVPCQEEPSTSKKKKRKSNVPSLMEKLQSDLLKNAKSIHGHRVRLLSLKATDHVALQLSTREERNADELDGEGHFNKREDFEKVYSQQQGNINLKDILKETEKLAKEHAAGEGTLEAEEKFLARYGNTTALIGQAGIGKSTLSKWLVELIVKKVVFPECEFIFYLKFQDIDFEPEISFLQLGLSGSDISWEHIPWLDEEILRKLSDGSKVAIIIDGLDEANTNAFLDLGRPSQPGGLATADVHIKNLFLGKLLPKAKKIFTSRPRQFQQLHPELKPLLVVYILGLDKDAQKKIFSQICPDEVFNRVWKFLNNSPNIACLCYVPVLCILIAHALSSDIAKEDSRKVNVLTDVFMTVLKDFFSTFHAKGDSKELRKLAKLAWNGFEKRKIIFSEDDLRDIEDKSKADLVGIKDKSNQNQDFLVTFCKDRHGLKILEGDKKTSFAHLTWQELFAAIHINLFLSVVEFKEILLKLKESRWEIVAKFIFGLFNGQNPNRVKSLFNAVLDEQWSTKKIELIQMAENVAREIKSGDTVKLMMVGSWLLELRDDDVSQTVFAHLPEQIVLRGNILPSDVPNLVYICRLSKQEVRLSAHGGDVTFFQDSLKSFLHLLHEANVKLKVLHLLGNEIGNIGMKELASCVENIQELELWDCGITEVDDLCAKIRTLQQPLKVLHLLGNEIGNIGMKELASCVENIQELRLFSCGITEVDDLCAKIRTLQQPLKVLHLSYNQIGNIGMKELASCVENIQELRLGGVLDGCGITEVDDLCAKIRTLQQPLKVLDLGHNQIGNIGMKELASCVENIQELRLGGCGITEVDDLCAKIRTLQQPLKVLDLRHNKIGNIGMKELASCVENIQELNT